MTAALTLVLACAFPGALGPMRALVGSADLSAAGPTPPVGWRCRCRGERLRRSARASRPETLNPGPSGASCGAMPLLHARLPGDLQAAALASRKKSSGKLRWALHQVARANPEALEPAQGGANRLQIFHVERGLRKQFL